MKLGKMTAGYAGALLLSVHLCLTAIAVPAPFVSVERARAGDGSFKLYLHGSWPEDGIPGPEVFSIRVGNRELPVEDVGLFGGSGEAVSYLFLMDVSGSIQAAKLEEMKQFLGLMAGEMGERDSACLVALGNDMYGGDFVVGGGALREQAARTEGLHEDTNLYYGIVESLKRLGNTEGLNDRRVLVILSDGEDDQATGITREEAQDAVREARIPVYTVAFLRDEAAQRQIDMTKVLGSFARMSPGGVHTALGIEDMAWQDATVRILESINSTVVLTVGTEGYEPDKGQVYLEVNYRDDGQGTVSDGYMAVESKLGLRLDGGGVGAEGRSAENKASSGPSVPVDTEKSTSEENTPSGLENGPQPYQPEKQNSLLSVLAVAVAVVAATGIIIAVMRRSGGRGRDGSEDGLQAEMEHVRPDADADPPPEEPVTHGPAAAGPGEEPPETDEGRNFNEGPFGNVEWLRKGAKFTSEELVRDTSPSVIVYLTKVGLKEKETATLEIRGSITLGRSAQKSQAVLHDDPQVSGLHCSISYDGRSLVLRDEGSKNDTYVNGVPISEPYILEQDDVIGIGTGNYRIHW